jgi:ATP-binding cassette subfamily B protein
LIRLFRYLKPFTLAIVCVLTLVFFQSYADLRLPNLMARIVDDGIAKGNTPYIWQVGKYMLLVALGVA